MVIMQFSSGSFFSVIIRQKRYHVLHVPERKRAGVMGHSHKGSYHFVAVVPVVGVAVK